MLSNGKGGGEEILSRGLQEVVDTLRIMLRVLTVLTIMVCVISN